MFFSKLCLWIFLIISISFLQSELENLAFMYTNPQDHAKIKRRVAELYKEHEKDLNEVILLFCDLKFKWNWTSC